MGTAWCGVQLVLRQAVSSPARNAKATGIRERGMRIIDISVPLDQTTPSWPGDPPFERTLVAALQAGQPLNLSHISLSAHAGTHVDAPLHFVEDGAGVDSIPPSLLCGACRVVDCGNAERIDEELVARFAPQPGERLLFRTTNSSLWAERAFRRDSVGLTVPAAKALRACSVALIGIDYLSVCAFRGPGIRVHHILLRAGIVILEGLNLSSAPAGHYKLICAPLLIAGADGAPARALLVADE